jgi:hypothetical protein
LDGTSWQTGTDLSLFFARRETTQELVKPRTVYLTAVQAVLSADSLDPDRYNGREQESALPSEARFCGFENEVQT